jgi:hypothetical protein
MTRNWRPWAEETLCESRHRLYIKTLFANLKHEDGLENKPRSKRDDESGLEDKPRSKQKRRERLRAQAKEWQFQCNLGACSCSPGKHQPTHQPHIKHVNNRSITDM